MTQSTEIQGIEPKHLNDDKIGRVMDKLYQIGLSDIFLLISLAAVKKFGVSTENCHLDSTSLSVEGEYKADSVFLKSPHRIEVMAMLMGLCLLVYTIGQRQLRLNLKHEQV
jgi:transposase